MIQQPELGKKIADYRKAKGLTQEELVDRCNLNVRTLQRIEAGEVTPRSYTLRLIFAALELDYDNSMGMHGSGERWLSKWFRQFYIGFIDLFNLKTNTMKKITILSLIMIAVILGIASLTGDVFAQPETRVKKIIEKNNADFINWFNTGDINSLVELYREDACLISRGCGKAFIENYYRNEHLKFRFTEITVTSVSVSDTIAVEKGIWSAVLLSGPEIGGEYICEWKLTNNKWLMVNESSGLSY